MNSRAHVALWLKDRCGADLLSLFLRNKTVPIHGVVSRYYFGGAIVFLFAVQVITGLALCMYYVPTIAEAFKSMEIIETQVEYGWLVRSVHKWASHLMVALIAAHLVTVFRSRAYRAPRELTWISGLFLLAVVLSICFFGYLLPWDERAFFATCTGIEILRSIPLIGNNLVIAVQGGSEFTSRTLTCFYSFHTVLLPGILAIGSAMHLYLIQAHGIYEPSASAGGFPGGKAGRKLPFYPDFLKRIALFWIVLANVLVLLALWFPIELQEQADRFAPAPINVKPEWYFLFIYQTLKLMPAHILSVSGELIALGFVFAGALFVLAIPFIDGAADNGKRGRLARWPAAFVFVYVVAMSVWGYLDRPPSMH